MDLRPEPFITGAVRTLTFLNQVYALHSQSNPLHADLWPSAAKFEAEIIAMTANMLGAGDSDDDICGSVASGGTEGILLAMKTYRDWALDTKGITQPEMILPVTAHTAFDKAAQYFKIKPVRIPLDENYQADVTAVRKAINKNTVVIVGSAPGFPHGIIDPIEELSTMALEAGIGFHTDACLGGFVLPWAEKLGYPVPPFDFRLAWRNIHVGRHPQIWLCGKGDVGRSLSQPGAAPLPILCGHRLAGRPLFFAYLCRKQTWSVERRLLGRNGLYR